MDLGAAGADGKTVLNGTNGCCNTDIFISIQMQIICMAQKRVVDGSNGSDRSNWC